MSTHAAFWARVQPYVDAPPPSIPDSADERRADILRALGFAPDLRAPLDSREDAAPIRRDGYTEYTVSYESGTPGVRIPASLLVPDGIAAPAPAVVTLHCHGGRYRWGGRKLIDAPEDPPALRQMRDYYDGRAIASDLTRRGYVVLAADAFYFGDRRLRPEEAPDGEPPMLPGAEPDEEWVAAYHSWCGAAETAVAKTLLPAGVAWPGIMLADDRRAVDFLQSRPEVDAARIACAGLSLGGFRAILLGGIDPRIAATVSVGWMCPWRQMLPERMRTHTWMVNAPGILRVADMPQIAGLAAPRPLMVINGWRDGLFTPDALRAGNETLTGLYREADASDSLQIVMHDGPHGFWLRQQEAAWQFLDTRLRR